MKGKGTGEHALLRQMLDSSEEGDIVVADRYYASFALIADSRSRGVDVVMPQHATRQVDFRQGQRLGPKDHLTSWQKPRQRPDLMPQSQYDALPETLRIRELAVGDKVVVTTLLSPQEAPGKQLKALYGKRWQIELNLRDIKTTLGMEVLRC